MSKILVRAGTLAPTQRFSSDGLVMIRNVPKPLTHIKNPVDRVMDLGAGKRF